MTVAKAGMCCSDREKTGRQTGCNTLNLPGPAEGYCYNPTRDKIKIGQVAREAGGRRRELLSVPYFRP